MNRKEFVYDHHDCKPLRNLYRDSLGVKYEWSYKNEWSWGYELIYYYGKHKRLIIKARLNSESIENIKNFK